MAVKVGENVVIGDWPSHPYRGETGIVVKREGRFKRFPYHIKLDRTGDIVRCTTPRKVK